MAAPNAALPPPRTCGTPSFALMSSAPVTFNGYRATSEGIAVWPRRRPKHRWADLRSVATAYQADQKRYTAQFVFADGRRLRLGGTRVFSFGSSLGRFAETLALALAHAPASARIDPLTRELARWGPRAVRVELKRTPERFRSADDWIALARHHRAWIEVKKALKAVDHALTVQSDHPEALRLRFDLLAWSGARRARLLEAAERWLAVYPNDDDARSLHLQLRLQKPDAVAAQEAEDWLARHPDRADLTVALASHHFRARNYERAAVRWVTFAAVTKDEAARLAALENEAFVRRYAASGAFRTRERLKQAGRLALTFAPVLVFVVFKIWSVVSDQAHDREMDRLGEEAQRTIQQVERDRTERQEAYTEATGMVVGTLAQVEARAAAGDPAAEYTLFRWYSSENYGVPRDDARSLAHLERAARSEHRQAALAYGERLASGDGLPKDPARAVQFFEKAARLGSPRAAALAGQHYRSGDGVPRDFAKAYAFFTQAADGGNASGLALAGWCLERGEGVEPDLARALERYRAAASKDYLWAAERLAHLLSLARSPHTDPEEAWQWTERGATLGSPNLRLRFAQMLIFGRDGTPEQRQQAVGWVRELALTDNPTACLLLARMHLEAWTVDHDVAAAVPLFQTAAAKNHPPAFEPLLRLYAFGIGVPRDPAAAAELRERLARTNPPAGMLATVDRLLAATRDEVAGSTSDNPSAETYLWQQRPVYPAALRRQGVTGQAEISFRVDEKGFTRDVRIVSATRPEFGAAAFFAVSQWRFDPRQREPWTESEAITVPVHFNLTE